MPWNLNRDTDSLLHRKYNVIKLVLGVIAGKHCVNRQTPGKCNDGNELINVFYCILIN